MADPVRVVIDCDTGVDDAMAVLYGLLSPNIDVVGLTCVWGNTSVENATANTLRLLEIAASSTGGVEQPGVPVAKGAARPLIGPEPQFASGVHGLDGQGNTNLPPPRLEPTGETAAELIVRLAREHPGELVLVPTGPLTNVAIALAMEPGIARLYREVVLMGGAFLAPGNASRFGEANIWHDPEAAQMVFEAGWPITAVGLDVTLKAMLSAENLERLRESGTPAGVHLHKITQFYLERYAARRGRRECAMHDALALGIAEDRSLVLHAPTARVDVELTGTHTRGMTVADLRLWASPDGANAVVPLEVDSQRFIDRWMKVIGGDGATA
ncbi:MAG TPA: nucleoside hydrolase [Chloroflexota bacterium]|nr:nucleoside hydrolase [Chloroflexota bacterium]